MRNQCGRNSAARLDALFIYLLWRMNRKVIILLTSWTQKWKVDI